MSKHHYTLAASAFLLGLFPVFFLPVLQIMLFIMMIGLIVSLRQMDRAAFKPLLLWRYIVFAQFCIFFFINAALYPVWEGTPEHYRGVALESWGVSLLCVIVLALWLHSQKAAQVKRAVIKWLPAGLSTAFVSALAIYLSGIQDVPGIPGVRIPFFTPSALVPPFWFLVLTLVSFAWYFEVSRWEKLWRLSLFLMAGVMPIFGGARLVMLAWFLCGCALAIWFYIQTPLKRRWLVLLGAMRSFALGTAAVFFIDQMTGGALALRMRDFYVVDLTYDSISQKFLRLKIWTGALSVASDNALLGIGQVNERLAIQQEIAWDRWFRAHQTYLSYLIAGGIPALISGLLMQSPVLSFLNGAKRLTLFPAFLGLGIVVTLNSFTDSVFQSAVAVQMFMVTTLIVLRASDADQPTLAPQKQVSSAIM